MSEDDGLTCDCSPRTGWLGEPPVPADGDAWPLDFAAKLLGVPEKDLRDIVRITGLQPKGTLKMTSFRRSGRHPRAYDASRLVKIYLAIQDLANSL
ncbi:MAG TPA: hypothetical protein VGR89_16320 [Puia sp.]|nr:hypothetical protein [Puia sp.]